MYVTNRVGEIKAMNDKDFKAFINDQSWELNKKTIEAMMEKELEKDVQEINVDFVDACMNYLAGYSIVNTPQEKGKVINKNKKKRIKFSRIIIAAILVVCSISIGMTVYAKANDMRISDIFVDIFDNKAVIKYSDKDLLQKYSNNLNGNKLYDALEAEVLKTLCFRSICITLHTKLSKKKLRKTQKQLSSKFENNSQLKLKEFEQETNIKNLEIEGTFIASKQIRIHDTDIYLFESQNNNAKQTFISYQIEMTQYLIVIDDDITAAEEFVTKNRI
mgnify:CR=1 FL=1